MRHVTLTGKNGGLFLCLALSALVAMFHGCKGGKVQQSTQFPPVPVSVAAAVKKQVPVHLHVIGNVEALSTVAVKAQVGGVLTKVHFKEGQDVNKGDLLFTIDPRPYEAALKQAEANLARNRAQLDNARQEARRYEELVKKGYVAQSQYDQVRTTADALDAAVSAEKAAVENARLQLSYCFIYAPISGRTGSLIAHEGNLIKANADTAMVVVNQVMPIFVNFSVPERYLSDVKKYQSQGRLKVEAFVEKNSKPVEGALTFIDNAVDQSTGTIRMKATFDNRERRLWPGQFVDVVLSLTTIPDAIVVPSQAVQTGQQGQFVFVIRDDSTAEARPVTAGISSEGATVIERGLAVGETVVTDGQMRLIPGARVEVKKPSAPEEAGRR